MSTDLMAQLAELLAPEGAYVPAEPSTKVLEALAIARQVCA